MAKTKMVFLDAGTVNWKDQAFQPLKKLGHLKTHHHTLAHQVIQRSSGFKHLIVNKVIFDREVFSKLKGVAAIHLAATGYNNIDLNAAREKGIAVTNVRGYSTESVVQITFASLLTLFSRFDEYDRAVKSGKWSGQYFFALTQLPFSELSGKTLGVIGHGTIGKRVAQVAQAFGMKVIVAILPGRKYSAKESSGRFTLKQVLKQADAVTIHTPLSDVTRNLIGAKELALMKKTAFLLNMARGGIVEEKALAHALRARIIAGAASDVLTQEPPPRRHVLYNVPRLILTPHIAWASTEARTRLIEEIARNIESYEKGGKRNRLT